jgi:hypothetical protein
VRVAPGGKRGVGELVEELAHLEEA